MKGLKYYLVNVLCIQKDQLKSQKPGQLDKTERNKNSDKGECDEESKFRQKSMA